MKSDSVSFDIPDSVQMIGRKLQTIASQLRADVDAVQSTSGALSQFDDRSDIEVVLNSGPGLLSGAWAVQVYVTDTGASRNIELVAVGDSGFTRAIGGTRNTISLSRSKQKQHEIAAAFGYVVD